MLWVCRHPLLSRRYCPRQLSVTASLSHPRVPPGKQGSHLGSRASNATKILLQSSTRQRSCMSRTRAMTTRAMVNVDFASPSMLLGAVLIGGGVVLLQMRNVENRVSRDADIVVAAMISIVGSTLIFQGWRLDPLLLLCQALTTSVAVWYGLEAFNLRSKEPVLDEPPPPSMLPPPPKTGDGAMPGAFGGYQQQYPPYQQPLPLQQQTQTQRRVAGTGYLKTAMRRRQAGVRDAQPAGGNAATPAPYAAGWDDVDAGGGRRAAYVLPPATAQQAYPWTSAAAPAAMPSFEATVPLEPPSSTSGISQWPQPQPGPQRQRPFGGAAAAAAAATALGGAAYLSGRPWGGQGDGEEYEGAFGLPLQAQVASAPGAAAGSGMGEGVGSSSGGGGGGGVSGTAYGEDSGLFDMQYDYYGQPLDPQALYDDGYPGSPAAAWHGQGSPGVSTDPYTPDQLPDAMLYYTGDRDTYYNPQLYPPAPSSQYGDAAAYLPPASYDPSYPYPSSLPPSAAAAVAAAEPPYYSTSSYTAAPTDYAPDAPEASYRRSPAAAAPFSPSPLYGSSNSSPDAAYGMPPAAPESTAYDAMPGAYDGGYGDGFEADAAGPQRAAADTLPQGGAPGASGFENPSFQFSPGYGKDTDAGAYLAPWQSGVDTAQEAQGSGSRGDDDVAASASGLHAQGYEAGSDAFSSGSNAGSVLGWGMEDGREEDGSGFDAGVIGQGEGLADELESGSSSAPPSTHGGASGAAASGSTQAVSSKHNAGSPTGGAE